MGLDLDTRQRAMLEEMHVRVWWPETVPEAAPAIEAPTATPVAAAPAAVSSPAAAPRAASEAVVPQHLRAEPVAASNAAASASASADAGAREIAAMDWPTLARTVEGCEACGLCVGRKAPVFRPDAVPRQADWMVVGEPPDEEEERAGHPFAGQAGQLLDNMLRAVQVSRTGEGAAGAWLSNVVKCRPGTVRNPQPEELQRCAAYLQREIALVRPKVILAMGRFAALSLLGGQSFAGPSQEGLHPLGGPGEARVGGDTPALAGVPFGKLRGSVHRSGGVAVVVTLHPARLLRAPADKALAWADLCLAQQIARDAAA